jgi:transcriptional regulator with XRE-family HTH domain
MAMSLDELANRSGMSKTGLWQIEKGKSEPGAQTIVAIARALDLTSDYLLGVNQ